jgi:hypothetical protein
MGDDAHGGFAEPLTEENFARSSQYVSALSFREALPITEKALRGGLGHAIPGVFGED